MLGAFFLYFSIKNMVYEQIDRSLITEMEIIRDQIEQTKSIPEYGPAIGHEVDIRLINGPVRPLEEINDTILKDNTGLEHTYRYIRFKGSLDSDSGFEIIVSQKLREKTILIEDIGLYIFFLFLALLVISLLINYFIFKRLWHPFHVTLDETEKFDIQSANLPELPETSITEFNRLNAVIEQMTRKMRSNYLNLKEYHENSSHEIKTQLAIIRSKLEILAQRKELRKESLNLIRSINDAANRLNKINQGLLLISKIDNSFFQELSHISLAGIIKETLLNYREITNLKKIKVEFLAKSKAMVRINETLADILVSNLVSNAVRYNFDGGFINCTVNKNHIIISNSGLPLTTDTQTLFGRFRKSGDNYQSAGLGLSIVKKITETCNMDITYSSTGTLHEIRLDFEPIGEKLAQEES